MATAVIIDTSKSRTSTAKTSNSLSASITGEEHTAKITYGIHDSKVTTVDYPITKLTDIIHLATATSILPFYVRFTSIGIPTYGPNNVPPIGIAIVGVSNYIL